MTGDALALVIRGLTKVYPGTLALDSVDLTVASGAIHALVGANGSGKSTLVKILAGVESAGARGLVRVGGRSVEAGEITPVVARDLGIAFVHQDIGVFDDLTITENMVLASERAARPLRPIPWRSARRETRDLLEYYQIDARPDDRVADLRPAARTMLGIARALGKDGAESGGLLVLDEPTATLPNHEVEALIDMLRGCAARGQAILFISHHLPEILALSDRVTVLRDGRVTADVPTGELDESQLATHICGRSVERMFPERAGSRADEVVLDVRGLAAGGLSGIDLTVRRGEIVGIAGLLGSGRSTLLQAIFGERPRTAGTVDFLGRRISVEDSTMARRLGMGYVPEDRQTAGILGSLSVRENHTVASLREFWRGGLMRRSAERADTLDFMSRFEVTAPGEEAAMTSLSGGNQQKIVLSRWLRRDPGLMLLDEPSQGVDVGSRAELYREIRTAADKGMAVLVVASDLEELAHVSDRVVVLREGRIVGEYEPPPSGDELLAAVCADSLREAS